MKEMKKKKKKNFEINKECGIRARAECGSIAVPCRNTDKRDLSGWIKFRNNAAAIF